MVQLGFGFCFYTSGVEGEAVTLPTCLTPQSHGGRGGRCPALILKCRLTLGLLGNWNKVCPGDDTAASFPGFDEFSGYTFKY